MTRTQLTVVPPRAGRKRGIKERADRLQDALRADWAHRPPLVEEALGEQMRALLVQLEAVHRRRRLAEAVEGAKRLSLSTRTLR
ncbi:hypothetical protein [Streptomyces sp. Ru62]|uniref:hypothetical protein n=1 Tax=Streptomyces sp. Ru62 TaxID=2080745 RepID=UPI0011B0352B|nr:hypothetical protein [Streptomyces sp. Ru62]